ncbi:putative spermidine/putrescine transport system substrate-binding protein [Nonomuraea solani]|uniref:Putative spermidine/putrescine transport system substrate-binding protein n=1 Tax=Nonomuraea solani TaxID=1144553 RepID=A0A1H5ST18_9ACTN|nr:extracellular solute-binding protein [Nonomuraea solani]SEF53699.1 putative spermidine/putrescine transport system substrate-binding protein [Nonomuraea solani]
MKRRAMVLAVTALVAGMGAGRPSPTPTPTPSPTVTQSDGTLQILTYRGYAEYGGTSPKVNWVGSFEKETGCRIARLDVVQSAEEMADRADDRPYDVISAGPVLAGDLIERKQAQPIDPAKVTGFEDIDERFRDLMTVSGKVYGVPYLWAYDEFLYASDRVKGGGLEQVFASDRTALRDSAMTIADAAMAGGAKEPYELDTTDFGKAMALLERTKDRTYWSSPIDLVTGFATGKLDYAQATPYYRLLLQRAGNPVKTIATDRTTGWVDSWMLGAGVTDTTCAYRWLNWMTASGAQRDAAAWAGMAPANGKACKGRARLMCELYGAGDDKRLDRVLFAVRPPDGCRAEDGECTDYRLVWTDRWGKLTTK